MKEKIVSFLKAIGYIAVAYVIQVTITLIYGFCYMLIIMSKFGIENLESSSEEIFLAFANGLDKNMNFILLISAAAYVVILMLLYRIGKKSMIKDFGLKNKNTKNWIISIFLGLAVWLINTGIVSLVQDLGFMQKSFQTFNELTSSTVQGTIFMTILAGGIIVPFTEEFLFRGIVQRTLSKSMSVKTAIIIQGVLFGIYHGNVIQGLYATFLGIVFGYVVYKSKSLWTSVIMHMVNNTTAFIICYVLPQSIDNLTGYIVFALIGMVILVVSLSYFNKNNLVVEEGNEVIRL
ncbi:CPBP family intramembrane glutamic endopeptidase [Clostridium culturomicium]|uniref:CPBP family intramembrane glutamic endopeptidase n=1 Tax=Clostridium culturomicium TaxID=1499683 RepID=UPI000694113E|nr:type II CAAX endopeptidase family protein [Clostridium culturomicium]